MQRYGELFARIYNERWSNFAHDLAPRLLDFYAGLPISRTNKRVLDVCCGTGQLAQHFLQNGYRVVGLDLSEGMLAHARRNNAQFVEKGQARFIQGDAADFTLPETVGLAVSTYDALNHLPDMAALRRCFDCVYNVVAAGGAFIFDLNTRRGLQRWNNISVVDEPDLLLVNRGLYDGESHKAYTQLTGFVKREDGLYERFAETMYNTVFDMTAVSDVLQQTGWQKIVTVTYHDLTQSIDDPEAVGRAFFIAHKEPGTG